MKTAQPLDCKPGSSGIERPLFSPGLLLEDEDLTAGVTYTRDLSRLLFRSLFGCGVICGLEVKGTLICKRQQLRVGVGPGLALDGGGNPIHLTKSLQLTTPHDCKVLPDWVWVVLCYKELGCHSREIACAPDADSQTVRTRAVDAYEIKLYEKPPECACACGKDTKSHTDPTPPRNCCEELLEDEQQSAGQTTQTQMSTAGTPAPEPDPCDCYKGHYDAVTCVDCGCSCVVIAKVSTKKDTHGNDIDMTATAEIDTKVDTSVRRWIRPVLTGQCKCRKKKTQETRTLQSSASGSTET